MDVKFSYISVLLSLIIFFSCGDNKPLVPEAQYHAFHGSRGSVCWKIRYEVSEQNAGVYADIRLLKENAEVTSVKLSSASDSLTFSRFNNAFASALQRGDRLSLLDPGAGYQARNIYSGEVNETKTDLEYKYPRLRSEGVQLVEFYGEETGILKITGKQNTVLYFDPETQLFYERNFQHYIDSLVKVRSCGLRFKAKNDSYVLYRDSIDTGIKPKMQGKIYSQGLACFVTVPFQNVELLRFPEAGSKDASERIRKITSEVSGEEYDKLNLRINNNVIALSFNGRKKFIAGHDSEGRLLWRYEPGSLYSSPSQAK